jgi:hypothetical protein
MDLSMPPTVPSTPPGNAYQPRKYVFDHVPDLRELLPKWRGRPGFTYLQCVTSNLRRAQDEGWVEVDNTVIYTIEGPKGSADLKLLCRGSLTPGQPHDSGARLCYCDKAVEQLTGIWVNPHNHTEDPDKNLDPEEAFLTPNSDPDTGEDPDAQE